MLRLRQFCAAAGYRHSRRRYAFSLARRLMSLPYCRADTDTQIVTTQYAMPCRYATY